MRFVELLYSAQMDGDGTGQCQFQFVELLGRCLRIESFVRGLLAAREALIKSLSDFILGFLCNARNSSTRIASYLRRAMTKQCIKILMKSDSAN